VEDPQKVLNAGGRDRFRREGGPRFDEEGQRGAKELLVESLQAVPKADSGVEVLGKPYQDTRQRLEGRLGETQSIPGEVPLPADQEAQEAVLDARELVIQGPMKALGAIEQTGHSSSFH